MAKKNTYFEQVPLEVVKEIVERDADQEEENPALKDEVIQESKLPQVLGKTVQTNGSTV
jgi:hypothetical protein